MDKTEKSAKELQVLQDKASLIAVKIFAIAPSVDESISMFHESLTRDTPFYLKEDILTDEFFRFVDSTIATAYIATYGMIAMSVLQNFTEKQIEEAVKICSDPKWDEIATVITKVGSLMSIQRKPLSDGMAAILAEFHKRLRSAKGVDYKDYLPPIEF